MSIRPVFRVASAGLDPRDERLIEIVFEHSQYNRYDFRMIGGSTPIAPTSSSRIPATRPARRPGGARLVSAADSECQRGARAEAR